MINLKKNITMEYFLLVNGENLGPYSVEILKQEGITPNTLVWTQGMEEWVPAEQIPELQVLFTAPQMELPMELPDELGPLDNSHQNDNYDNIAKEDDVKTYEKGSLQDDHSVCTPPPFNQELVNKTIQPPNENIDANDTVQLSKDIENDTKEVETSSELESDSITVDEYGDPIYTSEWLKENSTIGGWLLLFLIAIALGGLLSGLYPIVTLNQAEYGYNSFLIASDVIFGLELLGIAIYTIYAFNTRKPNAVFWAKVYTIMVLVSHFGLMCIEGASGADGVFSDHIRGLIWGFVWFLFLMNSGRVEEVIPSSYRQVKKYEWGIVSGIVIVPVLCAVIGTAQLSHNYSKISSYEGNSLEAHNDGVDEVISESPEEEGRRLVEADVEISRQSCPIQADEGLKITDITISGDYVIYHCSVDENLYSISLMKSRKSAIKSEMKSSLKDESDGLEDMLIKANMGIKYIYTGETSNKSVTITIEPEEL